MTDADPEALRAFLMQRVWVLQGLDPDTLTVTPHPLAPTGPTCTVSISPGTISAGAGEATADSLHVRLPPAWTPRRARHPIGLVPVPRTDDTAADDEGLNLERITPLGLAPATLQFDPADGMWVRPAWAGRTVEALSLRGAPGMLRRLAASLRLLHISGQTFEGQRAPFAGLDLSPHWPRESAIGLPLRTLTRITEAVARCQETLATIPVPPAPCLNAAALEAAFDTGSRVVFVDWRASGMGDPHFDLAGLSTQGGLNAEEAAALLNAYFGPGDAGPARDRTLVYRLVAAYLRLMDLHGAFMDGRADPTKDSLRRRFATQAEACERILDSASWTGAMDRLTSGRPRLRRSGSTGA
ncbi:hypothetical protein F1188_14900 [Roseospira marina]|uniref:Phosphotransferase n=1 Tax=Roseospira marina TaxID=140057 RepID=A0A5M6IAK8_9PROT|nr:hypothetical protein [Roseospira marina]KAA5604698.1 hypothetical protein F1188_14900 [Roseospira marina]MBB4315146.1 hypothetical protein [Roseospira marina]MBB5088084.1 hypothetical protein [Roseospira marina]